jgi:hypothetical protein
MQEITGMGSTAPVLPRDPPMTLEPIVRIPISSGRGGTATATLEFGPDVLYTRQALTPLDAAAPLVRYTPEIAAVSLALALVLLGAAARRILWRPRSPGRYYCRRCNYELQPPRLDVAQPQVRSVPGAASRCPECASTRPAVRGRRRRVRLIIPAVVAALVVMVSGRALHQTLEFDRRGGRAAQRNPWPTAQVLWLFPQWRLMRANQWPDRHRVMRFELPSGRPMGTLYTLPATHWVTAGLSPDGGRYVALTGDGISAPLTIRTFDCASSDWRDAVVLDDGHTAMGMVLGFSRDSRFAWIQVHRGHSVTTFFRRTFETRLYAVDLESGGSTLIATVPSGLPDGAGDVPTYLGAVMEHDDGFVWAMLSTIGSGIGPRGPTMLVEIQHGEVDAGGETMRAGRLEVELDGRSVYWPRLDAGGLARHLDGGAALVVPIFPPGTGDVRIDLQDGSISVLPIKAPAVGAIEQTGEIFQFDAGQRLVLIASDGRAVAELVHSHALLGPVITSSDGRWAGALFFNRPSTWLPLPPGVDPKLKGEILVWDLLAVRER